MIVLGFLGGSPLRGDIFKRQRVLIGTGRGTIMIRAFSVKAKYRIRGKWPVSPMSIDSLRPPLS